MKSSQLLLKTVLKHLEQEGCVIISDKVVLAAFVMNTAKKESKLETQGKLMNFFQVFTIHSYILVSNISH
jgi:hypothetical protein